MQDEEQLFVMKICFAWIECLWLYNVSHNTHYHKNTLTTSTISSGYLPWSCGVQKVIHFSHVLHIKQIEDDNIFMDFRHVLQTFI